VAKGALDGYMRSSRARRKQTEETEQVRARIMGARVQRSSIVDSYEIGRSTHTAWCFVQAGLPVQSGPDQ
jgi:hypothetical protein